MEMHVKELPILENSNKKSIADIINQHKAFVNYFLISVFVTVIDIVVSRLLESVTTEVVANTIGVITGFIIQYVLCTRKVYAGSDAHTAFVFFLTWLLGLALADGIVYLMRVQLFNRAEGFIYFMIAKLASIAVPFFITYFLRKKFIRQKEL